MTVNLTHAEREYLQSQPLARLATVDADGAPQNSPVGAFLDEETGDILIGDSRYGRRPFGMRSPEPHWPSEFNCT